MRNSVANMIDRVFGHWVVVDLHSVSEDGKRYTYWCLCQCGVQRPVQANDLRSGRSTSCGCMRKQTGWLMRPFKSRIKWQPFKPCADAACWCAQPA